ncbi:hypothetical protein Glove_74g161 [Diversispora epigaea]|uniref:Uncharacterized protein n=1 Tax=Diversispora epigaea TaxID=1348612 RepID=A0A397J9D5_9GLOM|nr:hypothetical protein Glove_74g161 [Diversispora epigaea]
MQLNIPDNFLFAIFIAVIVSYESYNRGIITMEMIYSAIPENTIIYVIIAVAFIYLRKIVTPTPAPIQNQILTTINADIKDLKRNVLALKNDMNRMQNETEWRSEARSQGRASITSFRSEFSTEIETLWVEFTALFDERRKREKCSPTKIYNALSIEINLSSATLATFYRHQRAPQRTSLDKIEAWVEKENKKKDNSIMISNSSRNNNFLSSGSRNIILDGNNENNDNDS